MFSQISTPHWNDKPLYIVAGGPSVKGFDFDKIKDKGRLLGVNDSAFNAPCDALFSLDQNWAKKRAAQIADFEGEKILAMPTTFDGIIHNDVTYVIRRRNYGLSDNPEDIYGINSGYGAIGLAYLKQAKEIYLLGMDMKDTDTSHWYKPYEWHARECHNHFGKLAESFDDIADKLKQAGIKVVNASPDSLIAAFPKCRLEDL